MKNTKNAFFAAANGYKGFQSYYEQILDGDAYQHVYVLKGGPGTGKSTLMRTVEQHFGERDVKSERILCSSDPDSLDGVILTSENGRVAIVDGTAPHQRDATLPGARDGLWNLAEHVDESMLKSVRGELTQLQRQKAIAYKKGYEFLSLCRAINSKIEAELESEENISGVYGELTHALEGAKCGEISVRLYNAFCKDGRISLPYRTDAEQRIFLSGNSYIIKRLMERLFRRVRQHGYGATVTPDALDPDRILSVTIPSVGLCVTTQPIDQATRTFYFPCPASEQIPEMQDFHESLLERARLSFQEAFGYHKEMELVYGRAIDFTYIDDCRDKIIRNIDRYLF